MQLYIWILIANGILAFCVCILTILLCRKKRKSRDKNEIDLTANIEQHKRNVQRSREMTLGFFPGVVNLKSMSTDLSSPSLMANNDDNYKLEEKNDEQVGEESHGDVSSSNESLYVKVKTAQNEKNDDHDSVQLSKIGDIASDDDAPGVVVTASMPRGDTLNDSDSDSAVVLNDIKTDDMKSNELMRNAKSVDDNVEENKSADDDDICQIHAKVKNGNVKVLHQKVQSEHLEKRRMIN